MATLTNWVEHLTTDVDSSTEGIQVAGEIYPMVWNRRMVTFDRCCFLVSMACCNWLWRSRGAKQVGQEITWIKCSQEQYYRVVT